MVDCRAQNMALKLKWLGNILDKMERDKTDLWNDLVNNNIPEVDFKYSLNCNSNCKDMDNCITFAKDSLWREIFKMWSTLNFGQNPNIGSEIKSRNLWYNSHIKD